MSEPALVSMARANDVTIVADVNHTDDRIPQNVSDNLPALYAAGVRHLYVELDPRDNTMQDARTRDDAFSRMMVRAEQLGIQVHMYDDRTARRNVDARYPEEAAAMSGAGIYDVDPEQMIADSTNPQRTRAYFEERDVASRSQERNASIISNINRGLDASPGERAVVVIGSWHVEQRNDVDEGLRAGGHQTGVIETRPGGAGRLTAWGPDMPDVLAVDGLPTRYRDNPEATSMRLPAQGTEIPWRNTEPVATSPASQTPITSDAPSRDLNDLAAALRNSGVDLSSLNLGQNNGQHYGNEHTGSMGRATTGQEQSSAQSAGNAR